MTDLGAVFQFEDRLTEGDVVEARWTNSHRYFTARATVKRVNAKTVRVTLAEEMSPYPEGHEIVCERVTQLLSQSGPRWSINNGVFPHGE